MARIALHILDAIRLEALEHSATVQERIPLTFDWWLMLLCPAFSPTCDLAFSSFLCSLSSCVVEGTTVSTRTSLSNFKRAQFPSKTCTRTDYSLLTWFFKSLVGILVLFCFVLFSFFTLLPHCHCRGRETARTPEKHSRSPHIYSALNFHQRNMNDITQETGIKITQTDTESSLEYLVSKVKKIIAQFKHWVHQTPCPVEDWEMQREQGICTQGKSQSRSLKKVHMEWGTGRINTGVSPQVSYLIFLNISSVSILLYLLI